MNLLDTYYSLRPVIPRSMQIRLRRAIAQKQRRQTADRWPILESTSQKPECWQGWPEDKQFALILTHDVETQVGHDKCRQLMDIEESLGFRSSFNLVPERYKVSADLRAEMVARGFEVGVHGLYHDGHLFRSRRTFEKRKSRINDYLREWNAVGFRAPSMRSNLRWISELDIEYDCSTFDTDPFEPHPRGAETIFPFLVATMSGGSYVELPYTLPQDSTLFIILGESTSRIWKDKLDWIASRGGMALINTHPDYMKLDRNGSYEGACYDGALYKDLLEYVRDRYNGRFWNSLPKGVARFSIELCRKSDESSACCTQRGRKHAALAAMGHQTADIWIDLDNTPHVPFFKPIIRELEKRGLSVVTTARDAYQVCDVADHLGVSCIRVGHHYGRRKAAKVYGTFVRACQLWSVARRERPLLAVSHGSRSQLVVSKLMGIPTVLIGDYEHTARLPMFGPVWSIAPEVIRETHLRLPKDHFLHYPGIKEDVYAPDFKPDPSILPDLGIASDRQILVTVRPPATEAHYHNPESEPLFFECMQMLAERPDVAVVLLPRNDRQTEWCRNALPACFATGRVVIPEHALDGLNLVWHSDLVISGGGTMNREAAALGVPVYSIFRGPIGAVDRHLSETGRLVLIETREDVHAKIRVERRSRPQLALRRNRETIDVLVGHLIGALKSLKR